MKIRRLFAIICMVMAGIVLTQSALALAASTIEIDDDEYNLYVDEYPDGIGEGIYAKMKSSKSDIDDYYLNFSSEDSEDTFAAAVKKAGIGMTDKLTCSMTAAMYKITDDEDKKVSDTAIVLLPVPDDSQEHPEEAKLYMVSSGTAKPVSATLVECDGVYYNQFTLSSYTTYGYVYTDPETLSEDEEEEEEEPKPTKKEEKDKEKDKKATPTPTKKPESGKKTDSGSKKEANPTKQPSGSKESTKDKVPKTGDDFSYLRYILGAALATGVITFSIIKLKK